MAGLPSGLHGHPLSLGPFPEGALSPVFACLGRDNSSSVGDWDTCFFS